MIDPETVARGFQEDFQKAAAAMNSDVAAELVLMCWGHKLLLVEEEDGVMQCPAENCGVRISVEIRPKAAS